MDAPLLHTPLYDWHVAHGGRMVDFAGWAMPVQYTSIIEEHLAIRSAVGIADISHMGRLRFEGPGAAVFLAELLTRRVADMELGQIRYSLVTNDAGRHPRRRAGRLLPQFPRPAVLPRWWSTPAIGRRSSIGSTPICRQERAERPGQEIIWNDVSRLWAMFAIQGPRSVELLQPLVDVDLQSMRYYRGAQSLILHPAAQRQGGIISRTGYTGEDGFELSLGAEHRPGRVGSADGTGQAAGRRARRPRRPRHAAARSRHAALRPRAFRTDRSVPGRPGFRLPSGGLRLSRPRRPAAHPEASRPSRSASAWRWPASGPRGKAARSWPAAGRSAKSPAEAIRPRSASRSPWATSPRSSPSRAPNFRSTSAAASSRPASSNFPFIAATRKEPSRIMSRRICFTARRTNGCAWRPIRPAARSPPSG